MQEGPALARLFGTVLLSCICKVSMTTINAETWPEFSQHGEWEREKAPPFLWVERWPASGRGWSTSSHNHGKLERLAGAGQRLDEGRAGQRLGEGRAGQRRD